MFARIFKNRVFFLSVFLLLLPQAYAMPPHFEIRSPLGLILSEPSDLNSVIHSSLSVKYTLSFGADILLEPVDYYGLAAGLRFDSISSVRSDGSLGGEKLEVAARLFSLIARKAYHQENFYWGPVGSLGVYMPSDINIRDAGGAWTRYTADHVSSFSIGAEAGWVWDIYIVSFEGGYHFLQLKSLASAEGLNLLDSNGAAVTADLSGIYGKFLIGLRF